MNKHKIIVGQTFDQWKVISFSHKNKHHQKFWNCTCSCGYQSIVEQSRLVNQYSTKCSTCANALRRIHLPVEIANKYGNWYVLSEDAGDKNFVNARCKCGKIRRLWKQSLAYAKSTQCHACAGRKAATRHGHNGKGRTSPEYRSWRNAKTRVFNKNSSNFNTYGGRGITMCERWAKSFENFLEDMGTKPSPSHSLERIDNDGDYEPNNVRWALPLEQVRNRSITFKFDGEYLDVRTLAREIKAHPNTIKKLLLKAKFTFEEIKKYSNLSHYQKIKMGESINKGRPYSFYEVEKLQSPVKPSPKRHPLWGTWHSMKQRCNNPRNKDFHNYGARGIEVCGEWATFGSFLVSLVSTIGDKPSPKHQLDRIDNNKNYEPANVRWSTSFEQAKNKQLTIVLAGEPISAYQMGLKYYLSYQVVSKLARLGWNEEGLKFFSKLTFKEKMILRIFASQLSQNEALHKHKTLNFFQNKSHQEG